MIPSVCTIRLSMIIVPLLLLLLLLLELRLDLALDFFDFFTFLERAGRAGDMSRSLIIVVRRSIISSSASGSRRDGPCDRARLDLLETEDRGEMSRPPDKTSQSLTDLGASDKGLVFTFSSNIVVLRSSITVGDDTCGGGGSRRSVVETIPGQQFCSQR